MANLYTQGEGLNRLPVQPLATDVEPRTEDVELEHQLRAVATVSRRLWLTRIAEAVEALAPLAQQVPGSPEHLRAFRVELGAIHVQLSKELWARDETLARAYELGSGLSDTYGRIERAYREQDVNGPREAWTAVFDEQRIGRLWMLLNDLQLRLPRGAGGLEALRDDPELRLSRMAEVVEYHLQEWRQCVSRQFAERSREPPPLRVVRAGLGEQTLIWRQLLCGERDPESFVPDKVKKGVTTRQFLLRFVALATIVAIAVSVVTNWSQVAAWYSDNGSVANGLAALIISILGALGLSPGVRQQVGERVKEDVPLWVVADCSLRVYVVFPEMYTPTSPWRHPWASLRRATAR